MKKNNKGFSFVVVILAMVISAIIICTVLTIVNANFKMKTTQLKDAQITYNAESGLNDIVEDIQEVCESCLGKAYTYTLTTSQSIPTEELDKVFAKEYIAQLLEYYTNHLDYLDTYIEQNNTKVNSSDITITTTDNQFTFNGLTVNYTTDTNLSESITTDIVITAPIVFGDINTHANLVDFYSNYALITDNTVVFNSNKLLDIESINIYGNIYAGAGGNNNITPNIGLSIGPSQNSKVNLYADKIITRGDIVTYNGSQLNINGKTSDTLSDVYVQNLRIEKGNNSILPSHFDTINACANLYVRGDTLLNQPYCDVKLKGTYYGFTNGNSAFCINGKNVNADLTGLTTLMLEGTSYLDIPILEEDNTNEQIYIGDSLTGKFSQSVYLLPTVCIYKVGIDENNKVVSKELAGNPIETKLLNGYTTKDGITYKLEVDLSKYTDLDLTTYLNSAKPYNTIRTKYVENMSFDTPERTYIYMNFKDRATAAQYLAIYNNYFKSYLKDRAKAFKYGNITLNENSTLLTVGNIISYQDNEIRVLPNAVNLDSLYLLMKETSINNSYNSLASTLVDYTSTGITTYNDSLYDYIINTEKIANPVERHRYVNNQIEPVETYPGDYTQFSITNTYFKSDNVVDYIENAIYSTNQYYNAIISNGDVEVLNDVYGIIITNGKCIVNPSVTVHGIIIAKDGIELNIGSKVDKSGYVSETLAWFLNEYTNSDIIIEKFRQLDKEEIETNYLTVQIAYKNWMLH